MTPCPPEVLMQEVMVTGLGAEWTAQEESVGATQGGFPSPHTPLLPTCGANSLRTSPSFASQNQNPSSSLILCPPQMDTQSIFPPTSNYNSHESLDALCHCSL